MTHIVELRQAKELADLGGALRAEALRQHHVRQARDVGVALLHDAERQHAEVHADDTAAHALALALAAAARAVARVAVAQQQAHARRVQHALLHGEALLVVAARDAEDVALELVADAVAGHLGAHAAVHEHAQLALIVNVDKLLRAVGRVGDVELHRWLWDPKEIEEGVFFCYGRRFVWERVHKV